MRRDDEVLRECAVAAVLAAGDTNYLAVIAKVDLATETEVAAATVDGGIEGDAFAGLEAGNVNPKGSYGASSFVTHDNGRNAASTAAIVDHEHRCRICRRRQLR